MDDKTKELISTVVDYGTALSSVGLAYLGLDANSVTVLGATFASLSKIGIADIAARSMSKREKFKIGTALYYASEKIKQKIEQGLTVRYMDLDNGNPRSSAAEILEGVLLKSKTEHEEKKIRLLGNLWANYAFREDISSEEANHYLYLIASIPYTKLCILAFLGKATQEQNELRKTDFESEWLNLSEHDIAILQQTFELHSSGLLVSILENQDDTDGFRPSAILTAKEYLAHMDWTSITPSNICLSRLGEKLFSTLDLFEITNEELQPIHNIFSRQRID